MLNEKNFADALKTMHFIEDGNIYRKIFADNVVMEANFKTKKLSYPAQIKGRDRNTDLNDSHKENLVVFECVNRLLEKGYKPEDIWLEKSWTLGHEQKSGRADICVSFQWQTLFIIECKTAGEEYNKERANMQADGGQLFSYWQQEQSCQWLELYASDYKDGKLKFEASSVSCNENIYRDAHTVHERFKIWSERYDKTFSDDVIFHEETRAYQIGVKPLRKRDLEDFSHNKSVVNKFEEILRHNQVSNKANAFNVLVALFICKLADESQTDDHAEVKFQFKFGSDTYETFQDRLQKLYADGMKNFMHEDIFYLPEDYPERLFKNFGDAENHENQIRDLKENFRKLKFFNLNAFAFVNVHNEKLFAKNGKVLIEVVRMLENYKIIGSSDLQTLGDLFEQLLDKGFKQDEGQFFTPTPITRFIWDSLPLDEIITDKPPKIIDYACGAGHFLTEGYQAVNDCFARKNFTPPPLWERDKLFGVEKDERLATVSKISLFMHGADEGKIKFGDGLENYPDENILPATFDILVANPPYAVKGFKKHLRLDNEDFKVLDKISNDGSEIETLFAERIAQLVKARGVAAVILPSSILNKDGKSFIAAREALIKNFYVRAVVQLESKTFGATGTNTVIMFLERFDEPPRFTADFEDVAESILSGKTLVRRFSRDIFDGYLKKIGMDVDDYRRFIAEASDKAIELEREKIIYFGLTYRQTTLIISAPKDNKEQEKFLGYGWSNAKGREGIVIKKRGGFLFDNDNRAADDTLAAVIRAAYRGERLNLRGLDKYYSYVTLADMLDFNSANFTKKITLASSDYAPVEYSGDFKLVNLGEVCEINIPKSEVADVDDDTPVSFIEMASVSNSGFIAEQINRPIGELRKSGYKYFAEGDIIIAKITPCMENGKCAIARGLTNSIGFGSTEFHVFRCRQEKILTEYLFVFLNREDIRQAAKAHMTGSSGHRRVPESFYSKLLVPLPPVDIQRQIVDEFKAIAAQIDSADETIKNLDVDIKNKFAELFDGKNFPRERLGIIAPYVTERTTLDKIQINNFITTDNMLKDKHGVKIYESEPQISGVVKFNKGDVLISNIRPYLKKIWLADRAGGCSPDVLVFRSSDRNILRAEYLFAVLSEDKFFKFMMSTSKGMKMPRSDKEMLKKYEFALPPLELQEQFAAYVTNCEALKESECVRREKLLSAREKLVAKYFR